MSKFIKVSGNHPSGVRNYEVRYYKTILTIFVVIKSILQRKIDFYIRCKLGV